MVSAGPEIHGFMHVAMHGHWKSVVEEQLSSMRSSGLYDKAQRVFVGLLGPDRAAFDFQDPKLEVVAYDRDFSRFEFPTIQCLHRFCQSHDGLVFYMHTKGVFNHTPCTQDWRRYMQHFAIERHEDCIAALADSDVCGVEWLRFPWPHFSGNFWWARADYVRTLDDPESFPVIGVLDLGKRHNAERWIGTGPGVRATCLFRSHSDLYGQRFPRSRYVGRAPTESEVNHAEAPSQGDLSPAEGLEGSQDPPGARRTLDVPVVHAPCCAPPIYGFMHVALTGHWRQIVADQLLKMQASGLWDKTEQLLVGLVGPKPDSLKHDNPKLRLLERKRGTLRRSNFSRRHEAGDGAVTVEFWQRFRRDRQSLAGQEAAGWARSRAWRATNCHIWRADLAAGGRFGERPL